MDLQKVCIHTQNFQFLKNIPKAIGFQGGNRPLERHCHRDGNFDVIDIFTSVMRTFGYNVQI